VNREFIRHACRAIHLTAIATITLPDHVDLICNAMGLGTLNAGNIYRVSDISNLSTLNASADNSDVLMRNMRFSSS